MSRQISGQRAGASGGCGEDSGGRGAEGGSGHGDNGLDCGNNSRRHGDNDPGHGDDGYGHGGGHGGGSAAEEPGRQEFDLDELWHRVFEDGEAMKGSFNLLRRGTTLTAVGDRSFTVEVGSEMMERFAKDNRQDIEALMEKRTGRKLRMICLPPREDSREDAEEKAKGVAQSLSSKLGISISVE